MNDTWAVLSDQWWMWYLWRKYDYSIMTWDANQYVEGNFSFLVCKTNWKEFPLRDIRVYLFYTCHLQEQMFTAFLDCSLFRKTCNHACIQHVNCPIEVEMIQFKKIVQFLKAKLMFNCYLLLRSCFLEVWSTGHDQCAHMQLYTHMYLWKHFYNWKEEF